MAMLAERKDKVKWSQDPRNSRWSKDRSKYGYRMLEQMGWSEGKGLGVKEDGDTQHIRISKKSDMSGVGSKRNRDEGWLEHQNAFDKVLAGLSAVKATPTTADVEATSRTPGDSAQSLEENAVASKKIVYRKFLRSKDLSMQRKEDLECVLGTKKRKLLALATEHESVVKEPTVPSHGIVTVTREQSVQDYFSSKMKTLKDKGNEKRTKKKSKKSRTLTDQ